MNSSLDDNLAIVQNYQNYRDSHAFFRSLLDHTDEMMFVHTLEGKILDVNETAIERLEELNRFKKLTIGRELKMIELKKRDKYRIIV
jgi:hypothetical protein